ncbi:hypothetical protein BLOT_012669 [Blomia tropicalis]|nr:hypothetical protein BLOT_012669 [Blomia tropicalis]
MPLLLWSFAANERMLFNIARRFARFEQYGFRMKILSHGWPDTLFRWMVGLRLARHPDILVAKFWLARLDRQLEPIRGWTTPHYWQLATGNEDLIAVKPIPQCCKKICATLRISYRRQYQQVWCFGNVLTNTIFDSSVQVSCEEFTTEAIPELWSMSWLDGDVKIFALVRMIEGAGRFVALDPPSSTPIPIHWWSDQHLDGLMSDDGAHHDEKRVLAARLRRCVPLYRSHRGT